MMAFLGYRTFNEMVGQADRLEADPALNNYYKSKDIDLSAILVSAGKTLFLLLIYFFQMPQFDPFVLFLSLFFLSLFSLLQVH